jgi:F420-dependent oxidoreductase-like protein
LKLGLSVSDFTWPGGAPTLGADLAAVARTADEAGFEFIGVMDHFWQIRSIGSATRAMLEAYTTLGFLAAHTSRAKLLVLVTGAPHRHPGVLAKQVTTLDVLSGGRAWLGLGAAWNEEEARGLGIPFPALGERIEMLEDAIQVCLRMWADDEEPFAGKHVRLERPLNSPQSLTRPHPPILIGGMGERKTLRLVARYAQACNLFPTPLLGHKLDVLKAHCEAEGRDYDEILKTCMFSFDVGARGEKLGPTIGRLRSLAKAGIQAAIGSVKDVHDLKQLEIIGRELIPAIADA